MNEGRGGGFSNGFMLGLIVGAALVFLLGTKTGKNLLKTISEEGVEGINELLEEYDIASIEEDEPLEEEEKVVHKTNHQEEGPVEVEEETVSKSPKRRFFRRVRR